MKRILLYVLLVLVASAPAFADDWVGPPQPCQVDIKYYFQFDDQREVARMLRKACTRCLMDFEWDSRPDSTLLLGCGAVVPDRNDHELANRAKSLVKRRHPDRELVFVMKMSRNPSLEEMVGFMELGVRFYREIEHYGYVARASARTVLELSGIEPIEWMGFLEPDQKYPARYPFKHDTILEVVAIPKGDMPACRVDLEHLGGTILCGPTDITGYGVKIGVDRLGDIASLWWVLWIRPASDPGAGLE